MATDSSQTVYLKNFYKNIMQETTLMFAHQFTVEFFGQDLPAELAANQSNGTDYTYYVKSSSIPKVEIDQAEVSFLSQKFVLPKQVKFGDSWKTKILLDKDITQWKRLYNWQEQFASLSRNGGGAKVIPNVNARVNLLNADFTTIKNSFILVGIFPSDIPKIDFKYENNSTIQEADCTFTYQYLYRASNAGGHDGDPLGVSS